MSRVARVEDALAIATVQVAGWRTAYRGLMPDALLDGLDVEAKARAWRRTFESSDSQILVVDHSGDVVGFVLATDARDDDLSTHGVGEIGAMYVTPQRWRRGHGRDLLHGALEYFATTHRARIILWVLEGNASARRFYEAQGFAPDGATKIHPASGLREVRYSCGSVLRMSNPASQLTPQSRRG